MTFYRPFFVSLLAAGVSSHVLAQSADAARMEALERRVQDLASQVGELRGSIAPQPQAAPRTATTNVSLNNGRPTFTSDDGNFSLAIRLLAQADYAYYMQGAAASTLPAAHGPDLSSGANFRRVNIGFQGSVFRDWNYNVAFAFGGNGIERPGRVNSAYLEYAAWEPLTLRIGAFGPSANQDGSTPNTDSLMLERASASEVANGIAGGGGRMSIAAVYAGPRIFASAAMTGGRAGESASFDEQMAMVGRFAALAISTNELKFKIGANGGYVFKLPDRVARGAPNGSNTPGAVPLSTVSLSQHPELSVDSKSVQLVDTGDLPAGHAAQWGVDVAGQWRNFFANAGYYNYLISRAPEAYQVFSASGVSATQIFQPGNNRFTGWYAAASWVLTGESRTYNPGSASFAAPRSSKPLGNGGFGAVEWAARYSVLDLNERVNDSSSLITDWSGADRTYTFPNTVRGGKQTIIGTALNWYPNNVLRFTLQYQYIDIDRLPAPAPVTTNTPGAPALPGLNVGQSLQTIAMRAQIAL